MSIGPFSVASLSQGVLSTSNATQLQQTVLNLQSSLSSGDLSGAQSAFATLQSVSQRLATASGNNTSANSQYSTDLNTLGSAGSRRFDGSLVRVGRGAERLEKWQIAFARE